MAQIEWKFSEEEINHIQDIIADQENNPFVQMRWEQNVSKVEIDVSEEQFWNALLAALLTSQQRSGPDSHVTGFLKDEIHTVSLGRCRDVADVTNFVSETLGEYGGIRYYNNIGDACEKNLERLDSGGWTDLRHELEKLIELRERAPKVTDYAIERQVATFLSERFAGEGLHRIGSKQSRNILQILGLTRYEIPLDSRITKWLNTNFDLPYRISGDGLSTPAYYHFIMDIVQDGCSTSGALPCLFDAAVFSSYDTNWTQSDAAAVF
jgi:hypothetical protein